MKPDDIAALFRAGPESATRRTARASVEQALRIAPEATREEADAACTALVAEIDAAGGDAEAIGHVVAAHRAFVSALAEPDVRRLAVLLRVVEDEIARV